VKLTVKTPSVPNKNSRDKAVPNEALTSQITVDLFVVRGRREQFPCWRRPAAGSIQRLRTSTHRSWKIGTFYAMLNM